MVNFVIFILARENDIQTFKKYLVHTNNLVGVEAGVDNFIDIIWYYRNHIHVHIDNFIRFNEFLVEKKIRAKIENLDAEWLISETIRTNNIDLLDYLIEINFSCCRDDNFRHNFRVYLRNEFPTACELSNFDMINFLLRKIDNSHPFLVSRSLQTACERGDINIFEMLFYGLNRDSIVSDNTPYIDCAIKGGSLDIVKLIIDNGASIDLYENYFLHKAFVCGFYHIVEFFLLKGADICAIDYDDIMASMKSKHLDVMELLLNKRDFNQREIDRLFIDSYEFAPEMVQLLIDHGADIVVFGKEVCSEAKRVGNHHLAKYLEKLLL